MITKSRILRRPNRQFNIGGALADLFEKTEDAITVLRESKDERERAGMATLLQCVLDRAKNATQISNSIAQFDRQKNKGKSDER